MSLACTCSLRFEMHKAYKCSFIILIKCCKLYSLWIYYSFSQAGQILCTLHLDLAAARNDVWIYFYLNSFSLFAIVQTQLDNFLFVSQARTFCFCVGFTLAFGALFSKTWRVYKIFTNKKLLKMVSARQFR